MNDTEKKAETMTVGECIHEISMLALPADLKAEMIKFFRVLGQEIKVRQQAARIAERRELLEWVIAWGQSEMKVYFDDHEYHMSPRYEDALASELIDALKLKLEEK